VHPASSIVLFTSLSGAGYGALVWLGVLHAIGRLPDGIGFAVVAAVLSLGLVVAGLVSSTFHLRHPERAWRALSQWRSSWLSREGVMALVTFFPAAVFFLGWILRGEITPGLGIAGLILSGCALVTVYCTAMIYRSLWTVPHWHNGWTVPSFLAVGLAGGALVVLAALGVTSGGAVEAVMPLVALAAIVAAVGIKALAWRAARTRESESTTASALGLAAGVSEAHLLEAPNSTENYLQREMVFRLGRKHADKLRRVAFVIGLVLPVLLVLLGWGAGGWLGAAALLLATGSGLGATLVERWLFFAEARHKVALYYGADRV